MKWVWLVLAGCASQPATFELDFRGTPALFAFKTDDGAWQTPKPYVTQGDVTAFELPDADVYEIAAVCEYTTGGHFDVVELRVTREELDDVSFLVTDCRPFATTVSGAVSDYGSNDNIPVVSVVGDQERGIIFESYRLEAEAAVQDLVIFNTDRIVVLRDQDLRQVLVEPTIDFGTSGSPIQTETYAYAPADPAETVTAYTSFVTSQKTAATWTTTPGTTFVVPEDAQIEGDQTFAGISATTSTTYRTTGARLGVGFPDQLGWLPLPTNVTFDGTSYLADWSPFAALYDRTVLACNWSANYELSTFTAVQTVGWEQLHGRTATAFDTAIPAWRWTIPETRTCSFGASRGTPANGLDMTSFVDVD